MTHLLYWCCPLCARCAATLGTTCKHTLTHLCVSLVIEQLRKYLLFSFCMFLKCFPEILKIKESFYLKCKVDFHRVHPWECRWTRACVCVCVCVCTKCWRRETVQLQNDSFGCCGDVKEEGGEEKVKWGKEDELPLCCYSPLNGHSPAVCVLCLKQLLFY